MDLPGTTSNSMPELGKYSLFDSDFMRLLNTEYDIEMVGGEDTAYFEEPPEELSDDSASSELEYEDLDQNINKSEKNAAYYLSQDGTIKWHKLKLHNSNETNPEIREPSVKDDFKYLTTPIDVFLAFFDPTLLSLLVENTNINIGKFQLNFENEREHRLVDENEMRAFLGLLIMSGIVRESHAKFADLWSTDGTSPEIFQLTMSKVRFLVLLKSLRFDNIETRNTRMIFDKMTDIREFMEILLSNTQNLYNPSEFLYAGKQLITFKGPCPIPKVTSQKSSTTGIRMYTLIDTKTFFTYNFEIFAGVQPKGKYHVDNKSEKILERLIEPIKNSKRSIVTNPEFASIRTAKILFNKYNLSFIGALNKARKEIPLIFWSQNNRARNPILVGYTEDLTLTSYVKNHTKNLVVLSTFEDNKKIISGKNRSEKHQNVVDIYCSLKNAVEKNSRVVTKYNVRKATKRWSLAVFLYLLNITTQNAFIVHSRNVDKSSRINRCTFLKELCVELVRPCQLTRIYNIHLTINLRKRIRWHLGIEDEIIQRPSSMINDGKTRGRCKYCGRIKDRKTTSRCDSCMSFVCRDHMITKCSQCLAFE